MAAAVCKDVYEKHFYQFTITSTTDGIHKRGSLHYFGLAFDIRIRHLTQDGVELVVKEITERLKKIDDRFQILLEDDHIHVERDRRR